MVLSLLAVQSPGQLWIIYLVAFGYGIAFTALGSAFAGLQKDLLSGEDLAAANAALTGFGYGLRIIAPLVGAARVRRRRRGAARRRDVRRRRRRAGQHPPHRVRT
jgi:hypothetical protein